jgi:hypothetical protein
MACDESREQRILYYYFIIMTCTDLFVLSVLYTPSEDTFNDIQKSGINLTLAGSGL